MPIIDLGAIGTVVSVIGMVFSLLSVIITAIKFTITISIFLVIAFLVVINAFNLFGGFKFFVWLAEQLAGVQSCTPLQP